MSFEYFVRNYGENDSKIHYYGKGDSVFLEHTPVGNVWYKMYNPSVRFNKWKDYHNVETSRETDYYTWKCNGPDNWEVREGRYKSAIFTKVGKYTITSVPHQVITNAKWNTFSGKAFDLFSDGSTNTISSYSWDSPKEYSTQRVDRTDLKRTWTIEIGPEEVNKPIPLPPSGGGNSGGGGPIEISPGDVDWDTQLIQ